MARRLARSGLVMLAVLALASTAVAQDVCEGEAQQWEDMFNAGDAAGLAALYTEDGMFRQNDATVDQGREEIQAWAQELIDMGMSMDVTEYSLERVGEEAMVSLGSWTMLDAEGAEVVGGEYMVVHVVQDGTCLVLKHFSGAVPTEGM